MICQVWHGKETSNAFEGVLNTQITVPETDGFFLTQNKTHKKKSAVPMLKKNWSLWNSRRFTKRPIRPRSDSTVKSPLPGARLALPTPPVLAGTMMGREATWTWMRMPSFLRRSRAIRSMRHQPRSDHVLEIKDTKRHEHVEKMVGRSSNIGMK